MTERIIKTDNVYPPIPVRSFDWCAWYDDEGEEAGNYGWGQTEQAAIKDLKQRFAAIQTLVREELNQVGVREASIDYYEKTVPAASPAFDDLDSSIRQQYLWRIGDAIATYLNYTKGSDNA